MSREVIPSFMLLPEIKNLTMLTSSVLRMKKIQHLLAGASFLLVAAIAAPNVLLAAESQPKTSATEKKGGPKLNVDKDGVILNGYDAVAYFKQNKPVKGQASIASTYNGAIYHFASTADKADFDKNPSKYAPQYGGFCANAMSKHKLNSGDPNVFSIYKGKLFVCSTPEALKEFSSKPDVHIQQADKNWQTYQLPSSPGFRREQGS